MLEVDPGLTLPAKSARIRRRIPDQSRLVPRIIHRPVGGYYAAARALDDPLAHVGGDAVVEPLGEPFLFTDRNSLFQSIGSQPAKGPESEGGRFSSVS